jgi:hypothetical protein
MPQTLPLSRSRADLNRAAMQLIDDAARGLEERAPLSGVEAEVRLLRERVFELADAAREAAPYDLTELHVALQMVSNELGRAERVLLGARN